VKLVHIIDFFPFFVQSIFVLSVPQFLGRLWKFLRISGFSDFRRTLLSPLPRPALALNAHDDNCSFFIPLPHLILFLFPSFN